MSLFIYGNNASSTMASGITNVQTTVTVQTGQGALFPAPSAGQQLSVTFEDTSGNIEVVYCTGITSDTLTVIRAQEGTSAAAFASGSRVEARLTKGMMQALLQKNGGDTLTGTTNLSGILALGGAGSIQGGEYVGPVRGVAGQTSNQISVPSSGPATSGGSAILTTANIAANLPSGYDLAHTNMIVMWAGSSGSVPSGWHICDGTSGTPNLQDRFIVGAGNLYALGATGGSATTTTGSTDPVAGISVAGHTLTLAEIPSHNHTFWTGGYGFHSAVSGGYSSLINGGSQQNAWPTGEPEAGTQIIGNAGGGGSHVHAISGSLAHTHSYTLPPYYGLFFIMKL